MVALEEQVHTLSEGCFLLYALLVSGGVRQVCIRINVGLQRGSNGCQSLILCL